MPRLLHLVDPKDHQEIVVIAEDRDHNEEFTDYGWELLDEVEFVGDVTRFPTCIALVPEH